MAMPGVVWNVPRWLFDPLAPLALHWSYLPALAPWLMRFIRAGTPEKAREAARALRPLVGPTLDALKPLVSAAGAEDLVHRLGHLYVYRSAESLAKDRFSWDLRRENGVEIAKDGVLTGAVGGKVLRSGRDTATVGTGCAW